MRGYAQGDLVAEKKEGTLKAENSFLLAPNDISLEQIIIDINALIYNTHCLYKKHAYKELYDAQMNLVSAKKSLINI